MFDWILNMPQLPVKNKERNYLAWKTWFHVMDGVQLFQGYLAAKRRQFTFYNSVTRSSWYSFNRPRKDERMWFTLEPPSGFNSRDSWIGKPAP